MPASAPFLAPSSAGPDWARHRLRRSRMLATGLLLAMGGLLAVLHQAPAANFWVQLGIAATEAAVVGGLADWFAVTALFRHPLGVPIPHTAIVPRSKRRIAIGIGQFIDQHFLDERILAAHVHDFAPAEWLADWLLAPGNAAQAAQRVTAGLPMLFEATEDEQLRHFLAAALRQPWQSVGLGPLLGEMGAMAIAKGQHRPAVQRLVEEAQQFINGHQARLEAAVQQRSGWWVPRSVDKKLARSVIDALQDLLAELHDPNSPASQRLDGALLALLADTAAAAGLQGQLGKLLDGVLQQPGFTEWRQQIWQLAAQTCAKQAQKPDTPLVSWIAGLLQSLGTALQQDAGMRGRLDELAERLPHALMQPMRARIRDFIVDVVQGWDTDGLIARLELTIGADLQYLRISGTLVAACVGTVLFLLTAATG